MYALLNIGSGAETEQDDVYDVCNQTCQFLIPSL